MPIIDYEDDELWKDLQQIVDDVMLVEEIPIKRIQEKCKKRRVDFLGLLSDWNDLVESCHEVASEAQEKMNILYSDEKRERINRTSKGFIKKYGAKHGLES